MGRITIVSSIAFVFLHGTANASLDSNGPNGINSIGLSTANNLPLSGNGVAIGQVETLRPGKRMQDGGPDLNTNGDETIRPAEVFIVEESGAIIANIGVNEHAQHVSGVMISTSGATGGVASSASLFSSAYLTIGNGDGAYEAALRATQHIATQSTGGVSVRAINHSWGKEPKMGQTFDGNTQLTLGMDWITSRYDVLNIIAGNQLDDLVPTESVPTDNFNGMTIAMSAKLDGVYRRVDPQNHILADAIGDRTSVSLLAPGRDIDVRGINDQDSIETGTSFATPHVTGTVALLQQYANERISATAPGWDISARRHEVTKAVLMNSADKIKDDGTYVPPGAMKPVPPGGLLGMERTVVRGTTENPIPVWENSDAYDKSYPSGPGVLVPLDIFMGTGHLNAKRAVKQFAGGEHDSDAAPIPAIGWDWGHIEDDDITQYDFAQQLVGGSYISITMAWDREVEFETDNGTTNVYDEGDVFQPSTDILVPGWEQYSDLDLYLMRAEDFDFDLAIAASASNSNVEHLFFQIPETGAYKFWIVKQNDNAGPVDYGIAWWALAEEPQAGDFDGDGDVDGADFVTWQDNFPMSSGATLADGDADGDGDVDGADFIAWQTNFPTASAGASPVPEPSAIIFALTGTAFVVLRRSSN